ncbi:hypothetical protein A1OO_08570 [Enterovibrio norvegicus FF-33]|uniref:phage adaptor protein n=1 Tax=Enterovibrio norvegicus TaxID=188144 RepID=UPI000308409E|nr:DUF6682 family protein [Enterovibrio norvegicus]OEE65852.1 hypothetical protein A1OO_08570 [Enterovibrio norvegicus FF-33]
MQISDVINVMAEQLIDKRFVRWSEAELLLYINQALSILAVNLPDEFRRTDTVNSESSEVVLPEGAISLMSVDAVDDMGVSFVALEKLNQLDPMWRVREGQPSSWTQAREEKTRYWLYPSPSHAVSVTHTYSAFSFLHGDDVLPIKDAYVSAVMDFVLHRAYGKDGQNASEQNKSLLHLQLFNAAIGNVMDLSAMKKQQRRQREAER